MSAVSDATARVVSTSQHPTRTNILNPAQWIMSQASDTCIQCHSQGRPLMSPIEGKYYDWPVGYHVGLSCRISGSSKTTHWARPTFLIFPTAPRTRTGCRETISCRA